MLSAVRSLPLFHDARAKATGCHLLCLDHAKVCWIGKEQYCCPVPRPKGRSPGQLLIRRRAARFESRPESVHSLRTPQQALYKSSGSCFPRYEMLSRPTRPRGFHPGLSLRDKLQTPRQDYSRRFHSLVVLPAPPAIGQWLLLYDLVESTPFPECYAPPRSQVLTPRICDNE